MAARLRDDRALCDRIARSRGWRVETIVDLVHEPSLGWHDEKLVGELGDFAGLDGDVSGPDLGRDLVLHITFWMCEFQAGHPDCRF